MSALLGKDDARFIVGSLPLSRSEILPRAIDQLIANGSWIQVQVIDGRYAELLRGLREGDGAVAPGGAATPRGGWVHVVACVEINQCGGCVVDGVERAVKF